MTPLASIMGSGFLVSAPLLAGTVGNLAVVCMGMLLVLAYLVEELGYDLRAVGVPKTVDNDLAGTDHCPGYGSAARFIALAVRDSGRDTESMSANSPLKIIEIMRHTSRLEAVNGLTCTKRDGILD